MPREKPEQELYDLTKYSPQFLGSNTEAWMLSFVYRCAMAVSAQVGAGRASGDARVLVVGDERSFRNELDEPLKMLGCLVLAADDVRAARRLLKTVPCDLVLADAALRGPAFDKLVREAGDPDQHDRVPLVIISADRDVAEAADWLEAGAEAVLRRPIEASLMVARARRYLRQKRVHDHTRSHLRQLESDKRRYKSLTQVVIPIGIALSGERNFNRLLEMILLESMALCNADAGTLYLRDDDRLTFEITRNSSLGMATGGTTGAANTLPPLHLYDPLTGEPNRRNVAAHVALTGQAINIVDAYQAEGFDFSGTRAFDQMTGYRSTSFLACPLFRGSEQVIGVLQLINAMEPGTNRIVPFDHDLEQLVLSMSSLASVALEAYLREAQLRRQLDELRIEIDHGKKAREVAAITGSSYFQGLLGTVREYRQRPGDRPEPVSATPETV
jgi:DNA-binding response OmpR family regulator